VRAASWLLVAIFVGGGRFCGTVSVHGAVTSIDLVFDEGTDQGTGYTLLDNIEINGTVVGH
jgi:hypothetical protein